MDNRICNIFNQRKILLKNLRTLDIKEFSKKRNYQLFLGIDKITREQDLKALGCLIASCLKYNDKPVGMKFIKQKKLKKR